MPRFLVVGASGQVARALRRLDGTAPGLEMVAAGRPDADLTDRGSMERVVAATDPDAVINAAAYTAVDAAEDDPQSAMAINAVGPGLLAETTQRRGIPLVHVSTDYVYDGAGGRPWREDDPTDPINIYGRSKLAGEAAVAAATADHVILRTAWVFGADGKNFVRTMLRLAGERERIAVVDDQIGNPTAAADVATAAIAIATRLVENPESHELRGVFNFAGRGDVTWAGFARAIFALSAERGGPQAMVDPITSADYPTKARRPMDSRLDTGKIERIYCIRPRPWRDGLAEVIRELVVG